MAEEYVYEPADQCENDEVRYTCFKCGSCGRIFKEGIMVDDGGTTVTKKKEER